MGCTSTYKNMYESFFSYFLITSSHFLFESQWRRKKIFILASLSLWIYWMRLAWVNYTFSGPGPVFNFYWWNIQILNNDNECAYIHQYFSTRTLLKRTDLHTIITSVLLTEISVLCKYTLCKHKEVHTHVSVAPSRHYMMWIYTKDMNHKVQKLLNSAL